MDAEYKEKLKKQFMKPVKADDSSNGRRHCSMNTYTIRTTKKSSYCKSGYTRVNETWDVCLTYHRKNSFDCELPTIEAKETVCKLSVRKQRAMKRIGITPKKSMILVDNIKETALIKRIIKAHGVEGVTKYISRG